MLCSNDATTDFFQPRFGTSKRSSVHVSSMMQRLAQLSNQRQWILFTGECPRPQVSELSTYQVDFHKVIHMKPSQRHNEVDIVLQAIRRGTASAIVASHRIPAHLRQSLITTGQQHHCEVFFVAQHPSVLH